VIVANVRDKSIILSILYDTVYDNPKVRFQLGDDQYPQKVKWLCWFIYKISMRRKAIYLSSNKKALIIFMNSDQWKKNTMDFPFYLRLFFSAFDWTRILKIIKMEKSLEAHRPKNFPYLYVWVLGADKQSKGDGQAQQLRDALFTHADNLQLPIFAETAFDQNQRVFSRFGFETYHAELYPDIPFCVHFLRRDFRKRN
jgi:hypothetical protein